MRASNFAILVTAALIPLATTTSNFRTWYPEYSAIFQNNLETACADEYDIWAAGNQGTPQNNNGTSTPLQQTVQCLLSVCSEYIKANMGSAAVLLGIMPIALSVLGSTSEESALLYVIARRPLLATLLVAGAPVVEPLRPFEYVDPVDILRSRENRFYSLKLGPPWVVLLLEYTVALMSVANVIHVTYQLGVGVICMILPDASYLPGLWAGSGIAVHLIGSFCLKSRLRLLTPKNESLLQSEFTLSSTRRDISRITVETIPETKLFLILSWLTSTSTTFHVIFGTLAYSSMQFISVRDAFGVIGRYTASVTLCRVVLMYELAGLRSSVKSITEVTSEDDEKGHSGGVKQTSRVVTLPSRLEAAAKDHSEGVKQTSRVVTLPPQLEAATSTS